jgi:DNA repair protein RadC
MHDLPRQERPRERLFALGPAALSSTELIAILLGSGTRSENVMQVAQRIINEYGGLNELAFIDPSEFLRIHGLGKARAATLIAALEIGRRVAASGPDERPVIRSAADAARLIQEIGYLPQEQIRVILVDSNRRLIATKTVYIGTVNAAVLRPAEIYREAVLRNAPALILAHNHPSRDPSPSPEDVDLTHQMIAAGETLDIILLDHIIIGGNDWRSLREMGLAFT